MSRLRTRLIFALVLLFAACDSLETGENSLEKTSEVIRDQPIAPNDDADRVVCGPFHNWIYDSRVGAVGAAVASCYLQAETTRMFSGPNGYPPERFAAYGIVAFTSRATRYDQKRHLAICEAYAGSIIESNATDAATSAQMVTVWPVTSDEAARELNAEKGASDVCDIAVPAYDLRTAGRALRDAEVAGADVDNIGPYLLAWAPSNKKGRSDALVLVADMSTVDTFAQAQTIFRQWKADIVRDPRIWRNGWDLQRIKLAIRRWVDNYGPKALSLFGIKENETG